MAQRPLFAKISNTNMGTELTGAGYTGLYSTWALDWTDSYMCLSGGSLNGYNSPVSGRQMVLSWYMRLKDGVQPGNYEVGFNAKQLFRLTGTYDPGDAVESDVVGTMKSITQDQVTYSNANVTIGEAGPVVAKSKAEVKMTPNSPTTVEDAFQFRVTSVITDADWDTYFANTEAGGNNAITKLGFVAYKGTAGSTSKPRNPLLRAARLPVMIRRKPLTSRKRPILPMLTSAQSSRLQALKPVRMQLTLHMLSIQMLKVLRSMHSMMQRRPLSWIPIIRLLLILTLLHIPLLDN